MIQRRDVDTVGMAPLDWLLKLPGIAEKNYALSGLLGKGHRVPAPLVVCSACGICSVSPTLRCRRFTRKVDRDKLPMRQNG